MALDDMLGDIHFLAGRLPHRAAHTDEEFAAAEYIRDRLKASTELVQLEQFHSPETVPTLLALLHVEFLVVGLINLWLPWVAAVYGLAVFVVYMAEITGFSVVGRFLPHYESHNVVGRIPAVEPVRTVVLMANYDSQRNSILGPFVSGGWLRWGQASVSLSMLLIIASCAYDGLVPDGTLHAAAEGFRWASIVFLLMTAWAFYVSIRRGEHTQSAINNASGVAVVVELARRFNRYPLRTTELMFVATGAKESGLGGVRQLIQGMSWLKEGTAFVNVTGVGQGPLAYTRGEGLLYVYPCDSELQDLAAREGIAEGIGGIIYTGAPTDNLIPLTRGYRCISVMGRGPGNVPWHSASEEDSIAAVDEETLASAVDYIERVVRGLGGEVVIMTNEEVAGAEAGK